MINVNSFNGKIEFRSVEFYIPSKEGMLSFKLSNPPTWWLEAENNKIFLMEGFDGFIWREIWVSFEAQDVYKGYPTLSISCKVLRLYLQPKEPWNWEILRNWGFPEEDYLEVKYL